MYPNRSLFITGVAWSLMVLSCGGGNGGEGPSHPIEEKVEWSATPSENTVLVSRDMATAILFADDEKIVASAGSDLATVAEPGKFLVLPSVPSVPDGLLARVESLQEDGLGNVVIQYSRAALDEAFQELHVRVEKGFAAEEVTGYRSALRGITFLKAPLSGSGKAGWTYTLELEKVVLHDLDNDENTTFDQLVANGSVNLYVGLEFEIDINWFEVTHFKAGPIVEQKGNLEVSAGVGVSLERQVKVAEFFLSPITAGPVVIVPSVEIYVGAKGGVSAKITTSVSEKIYARAGVEYSQGAWSPYDKADWQFEYEEPHVEASAEVKAYLSAGLSTKVYGVAGPYGQVSGYLKLVVNPLEKPWWKLFAGIEGKVGAKLEFLSFNLADFSAEVFSGKEVLLAQAQGGPPQCQPECGDKECGDDGCGGSCGICSEGFVCHEGRCETGGCPSNQFPCSDGSCIPIDRRLTEKATVRVGKTRIRASVDHRRWFGRRPLGGLLTMVLSRCRRHRMGGSLWWVRRDGRILGRVMRGF